MKYFDPALLMRANNTVMGPEQDALLEQHSAHSEAYERSLPPLRSRLSKTAWQYFSQPRNRWSLWDSNLLSFTVGDAIRFNPLGTLNQLQRPRAELVLLDFDLDHIYTFRYSGLHKVVCTMPGQYSRLTYPLDEGFPKIPYMAIEAPRFDCLFIEELSSANEKLLSHELFFCSGATITIEFAKVVLERTSTKRKKPARIK